MITDEQWLALHTHVTERIKTEEKFGITDIALERMFGITHPFWEQMCQFAQDMEERSYTADPHWTTSDGEPTEIEYRRKT